MKTVIVMFAKAPVPGAVKTRLGASIGDDWSARFHRAFLADLTDTISQTGFDCVLCYAGDREHPGFAPCSSAGFSFLEQPAGDLGTRLTTITQNMFKTYDRVIIIGSDSPTLGLQHFLQTDELLSTHDVVIGPSFDGGYYLIGLNQDGFSKEQGFQIFEDINWSSEEVLKQTLDSCLREHQRCELLGFWYDVDTVIDLNFLRTHLRHLFSENLSVCRATRMLFEEFDHTAK